MPPMVNRTKIALTGPKLPPTTALRTFLLCLLVSTITINTTSASCTLCEGSPEIPNPNAIIEGISCQMLSMALEYIPEGDNCQTERERAKIPCGCGDETDTPSVSPSSAPSFTLSAPPTMISQKEADCQALMAGSYPSFSSSASNVEVVVLKYHAEFYFQDQQQDQRGALDDFEDMASRVVSADAAGCYDRRNMKQRRTRNLRRHIPDTDLLSTTSSSSLILLSLSRGRGLDAHEHKIHFVQFSGLEVQNQESCSAIIKNTDGCRVVQGRIGVVYSPMSKGADRAFEKGSMKWAQDTILPILDERKASILGASIGIRDFDQVVSVVDDNHDHDQDIGSDNTPLPITTSSNRRTTIGTAVGCSAFALLVGVFSWLFIKRRKRSRTPMNYNNKNWNTRKEKKTKGGRTRGLLNSSRRLSKKVERVEIIPNYHIQSDDSVVEYVDSNAICCDDSVSNAPTVEFKKVNSIESTILTKSHSYDSSSNDNDEGSFPLNLFDDSSMESSSSSSSSSSLRMDEFSEMSPYDEMASYQIQKTFQIKSNQNKSVRFFNEIGEEHNAEERMPLPSEQALSSNREGQLKTVNVGESNSMENTVDL